MSQTGTLAVNVCETMRRTSVWCRLGVGGKCRQCGLLLVLQAAVAKHLQGGKGGLGGLNLLADLALEQFSTQQIAWHLPGYESASGWLQATGMVRQAAGPQYLQLGRTCMVDTAQVAWPTYMAKQRGA